VKRAPIVLSATVAGLAATLGFHAAAPAAITSTTAQTATSSPAGSTTSSSSGAGTSSSASTRTVTSAVVANQYGNVQLEVIVSGGKITTIGALQVPSNDPKSAEINAYAEPILQERALKAQNASVDSVSGATYTSTSYRTALQSALDKAGLAPGGATAS